MANRNIAVVVFVLFLAQWTVPANAKKITVGDDGPGHSEPDDWDKELDEEWEEWEKKSSKKKPAKEKVPEDPMEMIRRLQASNEDPRGDWNNAEDVLWLSAGMVACMACAFVHLLRPSAAQASYGRYSSRVVPNALYLDAKLAWCLQELPSLMWPLWFAFDRQALLWFRLPNLCLWTLFELHYFNRALVYPFRIRHGKPTRIDVMLLALAFCMVNGYMQARALCNIVEYPDRWLWDMRFIIGTFLFAIGLFINYQSDGILRALRAQTEAPKEGGSGRYFIPHGGLFCLVSCPNYTGECLQWAGFAVACWSTPAAAFAIATAANLLPRGLSHHRWYLSNLQGYPATRRAVIPFLL